MPVISLVSAKGSPGATTAAAALAAAAALTGDTLLVELDPSGGDVQILTGVEGEPGVVLAAAELRRTVSAAAIEAHVTVAPPEVPALLAPTAELMASSVIASVIDRWRPALRECGGTILVDAGRWDAAQATARRAAVGDVVAVVCRPSVASVEHARHVIDRLRAAARRPVVALVVGTKPYAPVEVAAQMEVPLGGAIAWDPRGVGTLWSRGVSKSWGRTWLASSAAQSLESLLALVPESIAEAPLARAGSGRRPFVAPPRAEAPEPPAAEAPDDATPQAQPRPVAQARASAAPPAQDVQSAQPPNPPAVPDEEPADRGRPPGNSPADWPADEGRQPANPQAGSPADEGRQPANPQAGSPGDATPRDKRAEEGPQPGRPGGDGPPAGSGTAPSGAASPAPPAAPVGPPPPPPAEEDRYDLTERPPVPPPPVPSHRAVMGEGIRADGATVALVDREPPPVPARDEPATAGHADPTEVRSAVTDLTEVRATAGDPATPPQPAGDRDGGRGPDGETADDAREPVTNFERFALGRARQRARNAELLGRDRRAAEEARAARLAARVGPYAGDAGHGDGGAADADNHGGNNAHDAHHTHDVHDIHDAQDIYDDYDEPDLGQWPRRPRLNYGAARRDRS